MHRLSILQNTKMFVVCNTKVSGHARPCRNIIGSGNSQGHIDSFGVKPCDVHLQRVSFTNSDHRERSQGTLEDLGAPTREEDPTVPCREFILNRNEMK